MLSQDLGFMSSWKMMTRDKGWIKPVLVLTLVGWIPILGQIVLLGYALEWARLTAWGVDAAPKQRGVDYGKLFTTGGKAFLVCLSMGFVAYSVLGLLFPHVAWFDMGLVMGVLGELFEYGSHHIASFSLVAGLVGVVLNTFIMAAALRATLYDSFAAGWRLDRLCQMIARDFGGFARVVGVALVGAVCQWVYRSLVAIVAAIATFGGVLGAVSVLGVHGAYYYDAAQAVNQLLSFGAAPLLILVVLVVAAGFAGSVLSTAMSLVSINAVGQWFNRFDVNRWGVSSAPLPDGVPIHAQGARAATAAEWPPRDSAPVSPVSPAADAGAAAGSAPGAAGDGVRAAASGDVADAASAGGAGTGAATAPKDVAGDGVGADEASASAAASSAAETGVMSASAGDVTGDGAADGDEPGDEAAGEPARVPERPREPIALGPITTEEEEGPVVQEADDAFAVLASDGADDASAEDGPVQRM